MYFNSVISDTTKLLKPILVFAFAIAAGVCGLTQITQYRSHPVDVYAGFLIGAGIAAYLVRVGAHGKEVWGRRLPGHLWDLSREAEWRGFPVAAWGLREEGFSH